MKHVLSKTTAGSRVATRMRAGFTLVELMVAMLAGSFVITGTYYMSDVSSHMFSEQLRRSETQMTLRSATELLRRDIGRAGYLSVRDSTQVPACDATAPPGSTGPGQFDVTPQIVTAVSVDIDPATGRQRLFVTGNLTTSDQYFVSSSNGMSLQLQNTNESFRRSFVNPVDGTFLRQRFLEAFFADPALPGRGRMISVADLSKGRLVLRNIANVVMATTPPTLTLETGLPMDAMGGGCMNFDKIVVAPVTTVRYAMQVPGPELARVGGRSYLTGASATDATLHPVLVRSEVDLGNSNAVLPGTERVVLDSITDSVEGFRISAVIDNAAAPAVNLVHTATPETLGVAMGQIRSLSIQLIVESAERIEAGAAQDRLLAAQRARRIIRFDMMLPNAARNAGLFQ